MVQRARVGTITPVIAEDLDTLDPEQLRQALRAAGARRHIAFKQAVIDKLTHENAILKRLKFAAKSEAFSAEQKSLLEETLEADLAAVAAEIERCKPRPSRPATSSIPKRAALPAHLPRREIRHEPEHTTCACGCPMKRIGEDVAEKLDYQPGVFTSSATSAASGSARAARRSPRRRSPRTSSTRASPPVACSPRCWWPSSSITCRCTGRKASSSAPGLAIAALDAGAVGRRLRGAAAAAGGCPSDSAARLQSAARRRDAGGDARAGQGQDPPGVPVELLQQRTRQSEGGVFDFAESRGGHSHSRAFLEGWKGTLVCDDFSGYKALFAQGVTEAGCLAHARRKFHELWVSHKSALAEQALKSLPRALRRRARPENSMPSSAIGCGNCDPGRWPSVAAMARLAPTACERRLRHRAGHRLQPEPLDGADALPRGRGLPIDNNWVENRIRPIALGRSNWLFAGSLRVGKRAAAAMSLIQSAKLNGHDPYAYIGRARAAAHAAGQPDRGAAAASLALKTAH
jgi:transposase